MVETHWMQSDKNVTHRIMFHMSARHSCKSLQLCNHRRSHLNTMACSFVPHKGADWLPVSWYALVELLQAN